MISTTFGKWTVRVGQVQTSTRQTLQPRPFFTRVASIMATMSLVGAALVPPAAHADDPLWPIKATIERDREKGCHDTRVAFSPTAPFHWDPDLEAIAQTYARTEKIPDTPPPRGFQNVVPYIGTGDPQAQATTRAYDNGARKWIGNCRLDMLSYGVGFSRHGERDVVTIVLGVRSAPVDPPADKKLAEYCKKFGDDWRLIPQCGGAK